MIELVNPKTHAVIPEPQVNAIFLYGSILFFSKIDINSSFFLIQGLIFPQMKIAMRGELNNYNQIDHDTSTYGWNSFQKTLGCCGVKSYKDWNGTKFDTVKGIF